MTGKIYLIQLLSPLALRSLTKAIQILLFHLDSKVTITIADDNNFNVDSSSDEWQQRLLKDSSRLSSDIAHNSMDWRIRPVL